MKITAKHIVEPERGFVFAIGWKQHSIGLWIGYGKPIWWKPRLIGRGSAKYGFGAGWLALCCRIQVR